MRLQTIFILAIFLTGCECSYQYAVYAKNDTQDTLTVHFTTYVDSSGKKAETLKLLPGELRQMLYSTDLQIDNSCLGTNRNHCQHLLDDLTVLNRNGMEARLKLCDPEVRFEKVDIHQAEFMLEYTSEHFSH